MGRSSTALRRTTGVGQLSLVEHALCPLDARRSLVENSVYRSEYSYYSPTAGKTTANYWRVSHEFLLLGVRGRLPFADNMQRSWLLSRRRQHSRKPYAVRELIEKVSPGPYLELFGREELPASEWTVFGDQVERRLF